MVMDMASAMLGEEEDKEEEIQGEETESAAKDREETGRYVGDSCLNVFWGKISILAALEMPPFL